MLIIVIKRCNDFSQFGRTEVNETQGYVHHLSPTICMASTPELHSLRWAEMFVWCLLPVWEQITLLNKHILCCDTRALYFINWLQCHRKRGGGLLRFLDIPEYFFIFGMSLMQLNSNPLRLSPCLQGCFNNFKIPKQKWECNNPRTVLLDALHYALCTHTLMCLCCNTKICALT